MKQKSTHFCGFTALYYISILQPILCCVVKHLGCFQTVSARCIALQSVSHVFWVHTHTHIFVNNIYKELNY